MIYELSRLELLQQNNRLSFCALAGMSNQTFAQKQKTFVEDSRILAQAVNAVAEARNRVTAMFTPEVLNLNTDSYENCIRKLEACLADFDRLGNWIGFMELLGQLYGADLGDYIDTVIREQLKAEEIVGAYRKLFYRQWIESILFSDPELASFSRVRQDQAVRNFVSKDDLQYDISKAQIRSELSQMRPNLDMMAAGSAVSLLRREGNKKRKPKNNRTNDNNSSF